MTKWARLVGGRVVELMDSALSDDDFRASREGQDVVHASQVSFADMARFAQEQAARTGAPPMPIFPPVPPTTERPQP